jgi:glycosyltransferase involved in cell wall biosynthesis
MRALKYVSWGDTTGYAVAAKAYVRALLDAGVDLTWAPMLTGKGLYEAYTASEWPCPKLGPVCNRTTDYDTVLIHTVPEYYPAWIERERRPGRRILGYTVWELERLPNHWPAILNRLDGVLVPCRWNEQVFRESGVTVPIHVVPHLSQFESMSDVSTADRISLERRLGAAVAKKPFIFYTVAFWSHRKAPYLALEAYFRAFSESDPVLMVVKTSERDITRWHRHWRNAFRLRHPTPQETVRQIAKRHKRPAPVVMIADESLSDGEMRALHESGDCFVSLARTEGWGLGAFEAARLGRPVVMTGYGGQLDFLDPDLAWLVDYQMVPVCEPTWSANYRPTDLWAEPSVDQAAAHLRAIYAEQEAAQARATQLSDRIRNSFAKNRVVSAMLRALTAGDAL